MTPEDLNLFLVTDDVERARSEICGFYVNYDSMRFVGDELVIRLRHAPSGAQLAELDERFGDLLLRGKIELTSPLPEEVADDDRLDLPRIKLAFDKRRTGVLRTLIDSLNDMNEAT